MTFICMQTVDGLLIFTIGLIQFGFHSPVFCFLLGVGFRESLGLVRDVSYVHFLVSAPRRQFGGFRIAPRFKIKLGSQLTYFFFNSLGESPTEKVICLQDY